MLSRFNQITKWRLIEVYEKGIYIIDMRDFDYKLLDNMAYGLEREHPRYPNYSVEKTSKIIDYYLNQLKQVLNQNEISTS